MKTPENKDITIETTVNVPVEKVWEYWSEPRHIIKWCSGSDDWHSPYAENDLRPSGKFKTRMEAKDGSDGFDFDGEYTKVNKYKIIEYKIKDGRKVAITFDSKINSTRITEIFEAEDVHTSEQQREGWQHILNNFKNYCESMVKKQTMHFAIAINSSPEKVYHTIIDKDHYGEWTSAFASDSHFIGSWDKGSRIMFLGHGPDGKMGGMIGIIKENKPFKHISIEYLGMIEDGEELTTGPEVENWQGSTENYTFTEKNGSTLLSIDVDANEAFKDFFQDTWPKALKLVKDICEGRGPRQAHLFENKNRIYPCLWFDNNAMQAAEYYCNIFGDSRITSHNDMAVTFDLNGQKFMALNGGPMYTPNPSISFYVLCETKNEVDRLWNKLIVGGSVLMPLDKYSWTDKYGWLKDRYGISWQLAYGDITSVGQKISTTLLFTNDVFGKVEEALKYYSSIFKNSSIDQVERYKTGDGDVEGKIMHARFSLENYVLMAMESSRRHDFRFNEGISLVVDCETQQQIDYYWDKLVAGGGQESQCGWLKDRYGVSWQIVPTILPKLLADPSRVERVTRAFMKMKKLEIDKLISA
jgi:predicted 3-demethylubiquinone-9 3-methyltransferase (glyoxalase superfamily)/uncharacterized protein YndB with AHSA1/START domain